MATTTGEFTSIYTAAEWASFAAIWYRNAAGDRRCSDRLFRESMMWVAERSRKAAALGYPYLDC